MSSCFQNEPPNKSSSSHLHALFAIELFIRYLSTAKFGRFLETANLQNMFKVMSKYLPQIISDTEPIQLQSTCFVESDLVKSELFAL